MENSNRNIHTEFFDHFHYDKKEDYYWNIVSVSKDDENKRSVYCGINKEDKNDCIYVKQIKISFENNQNFFNNQILSYWGLGIGDWGLGIGDWGLGPIPNPQSPIPNPQYQEGKFI